MTGLIQAAINGRRSKAEHPAIPVTPEEQAAAAAQAVAAGAGAIHVHVRAADETESIVGTDVSNAVTAIRAAAPGTPVGVSTGAWILRDERRRLEAVRGWTVLPDYASVNFDEAGATELAELLRSRGIGIEAGLANSRGAEILADSGLGGRCLRMLLEPDDLDVDTALRALAHVEAILDRARITVPRLLHGVGPTAWPLIDAAAARHYDTRVGFEDTLTLPDGARAPSNAALVAAARRRARG